MYIIQTISDADCLGVAQLVEHLTVRGKGNYSVRF